MMTAKSKRKVRADSKLHSLAQTQNDPFPHSKQALKLLSLSFYGQETIKKQKQVILDDCDLGRELPVFSEPAIQKAVKSHRFSHVPSRKTSSKKKDSILQMENYFFEQKYDQIELVPTNSSHYDLKPRESSLSKIKLPFRPPTSKTKKSTTRVSVDRRNCQTVLGRQNGRKSQGNGIKANKKTVK